MLLSPTLLLLFSSICVVLVGSKRLKARRQNQEYATSHGCQPPIKFSRFDNILEQIKAIQSKTWLEMWWRRYATIGTTFESATVSIDSIIFTNEPENIKSILATQFKTFELGDRRRNLMGPLIGPGIFSNDGAAWKHSRNLIRPNFAKMQISDLSTFEQHFQELLKALPPSDPVSAQIEVDLQPLFFRMTLDSASELLLGSDMSFHSQSDPPGSISLQFMDAFDYAQMKVHRRNILERGWTKPIGLLYQISKCGRKDRFERACDTMHSIIDDMIRAFLTKLEKTESSTHSQEGDGEGDDGKYVFLHEMAKTTSDPLELRHEILNVLVAGRDTTASLLSNVFFILARRPDLWASVRAEVVETFNGRLPDYETLRSMRQVRNLMNECLRLYPPVPMNSRTAIANTTLPHGGGSDGQSPLFIKKGQQVNYHVYALHRSPEIFGPDPLVFRPERWDDPSLRPGWGYIPFNGGARICPGQQFALTEASYTLVRLMQEFEMIERRDEEWNWREHIALVTKSRNGTKVALKKATKVS